MAPELSNSPSAMLTFGRLAPSICASSLWENPSSSGRRLPGGARRSPNANSRKRASRTFSGWSDDRLQLARGLALTPAQERDHRRRNCAARGPQRAKGVPLERIGRHLRERGCVGAARTAVECRDLAEQIARRRHPEAQLPTVFVGDRQPHAPFSDQIELRPRLAAGEQHLHLWQNASPGSLPRMRRSHRPAGRRTTLSATAARR